MDRRKRVGRQIRWQKLAAIASYAPKATMIRGATRAISASSQGKQASISTAPGLLWMRRGPRGTHLKCLTTLVT